MIQNPLNALKRRLEDDSTAFPKRLRLAKNVVQTHHFPATPKERIIAEWILEAVAGKKLSNEAFRSVLGWLNSPDVTSELKNQFIKVTSTFLLNNTLEDTDIPCLISFLENDKITEHLLCHTKEFCFITTSLLSYIQEKKLDYAIAKNLLKGLTKYYKASKKKLEVISQILQKNNLNIVLSYLDTDCNVLVQNLCDTVLFPMSKKSFFVQYFRTILQKENLDGLITEKGDSIQAVLKVMDVFFNYKTQSNDVELLKKFVTVFITSFKTESSLIFAFYIIASNTLSMPQNYINPTMKLAKINFEDGDDKIKRALFLHMLETLYHNEVDINVKLTDTISDSKTHIKKEFSQFLQAVMMGQLKLEGKVDKTTLLILKTALQLDPTIIENKLDKVLPSLLVSKKTSQVMEIYTDMFNCLLEIVFKLSRGINFIHHILANMKDKLLSIDNEQSALLQQLDESNSSENQKIQSKILYGSDVIPAPCAETFGRLASELMYRQQPELLMLLETDLVELCVKPLEEGTTAPSTLTLLEVLGSVLRSYLTHSRFSRAAPASVARAFRTRVQHAACETLGRLGESALAERPYAENQRITTAFLTLSSGLAKVELLHLKYSGAAAEVCADGDVFDLGLLLPGLSAGRWSQLAAKATGSRAAEELNTLLLLKTIALELVAAQNDGPSTEIITKTHLLKELSKNTALIHAEAFSEVIFNNLQENQLKTLAKILIKDAISNENNDIFDSNAVVLNKPLTNALVQETLKIMTKNLENSTENPSITKALGRGSFDFATFASEINDMPAYFDGFTHTGDNSTVSAYLDILHKLPIHDLDENHQISTVFVLLVVKNKSDSKKIRKSIDNLLYSIFELSSKHPDLFKAFPTEYMFDFANGSFLNLVTLKDKPDNTLIIKSIVETAVKKVKSNSEIIKTLVKILLTNQKIRKEDSESLEYFSDRVFQISCMTLPILGKEKRALTTSAYRSILAELQEKLHKSLLKSFKKVNFGNEHAQFLLQSGNTEFDAVADAALATLNAMEAFSLTLAKYCDADAEGVKSLDCLWSGLGFFVQSAITTISGSTDKLHVTSAIQLITVTLRNVKKLETHDIFGDKNALFIKIWKAVKDRLFLELGARKNAHSCVDDVCVVAKLVCELTSVECFVQNMVGDLYTLLIVKKPSQNPADTSGRMSALLVGQQLWSSSLRANLLDKKCLALAKSVCRSTRDVAALLRRSRAPADAVRVHLDVLAGVVLAAKKIPLNHHFMDAIFDTQNMCLELLNQCGNGAELAGRGGSGGERGGGGAESYFTLFDGVMAVLNSLVMSRSELLEDRWPCFTQCYRSLVTSLCELASAGTPEPAGTPGSAGTPGGPERAIAAAAHSIEKLTQSMCKCKPHVSRAAAYLLADCCRLLEAAAPAARQPLENAAAHLIQASDSAYTLPFLKRALAGKPGHMTITSLFTIYKRYHKYVGNA